MGSYKYLNQIMENKLSNLHTAYLAKVLSVSGKTAKIQPLGLVTSTDGETSEQSVLTAVPICEHVKHISTSSKALSVMDYGTPSQRMTINPEEHGGHVVISPIKKGDIVICLCCEKNISEALEGKNTTTPIGRHSMSNSVIVGVL